LRVPIARFYIVRNTNVTTGLIDTGQGNSELIVELCILPLFEILYLLLEREGTHMGSYRLLLYLAQSSSIVTRLHQPRNAINKRNA